MIEEIWSSIINQQSEIINPFGVVNLVNPSRCAFLSPPLSGLERCDSIQASALDLRP
jgi:hypothetical protein